MINANDNERKYGRPPHRHLKERARTKVRAFFSPKATLQAEESPEKKTGIEFCDLLIALTNSM
ncbi:hypothetical protein ACFLM0_003810, partial [Salmonella enterica]